MTPYNKKEPKSIRSMFDGIAANYDRTNSVLSLYLHHYWNSTLVKNVILPCSPSSMIDLCAGTGEIAFRSIQASPSLKKVSLVDFSSEMLACAQEKSKDINLKNSILEFINADVQKLPFESESTDCITMAYGIRNVNQPFECLQESYRVLKFGGSLGILELTAPTNKLLKFGHQIYLKNVLPVLGKWLTSDKEAYKYLCQSIHSFIRPTELKATIIEAGFKQLTIKPLAGGIATLFIAQKI